ncbi:MAG TPA: aminopeptidase P N-terminal domain-containing protein [Bacilli bacterium]|nr:aminopeptidase P N-terminal domain-containing protein [Bacilli bacterium]
MNNKSFSKRREALLDKLPDNSLVIVFAGVPHKASADAEYPFQVNTNFLYLTGIKQEHSVLVLAKIDQERFSYLFIDSFDELKEKWTGKKLKPEQAIKISGIKNILFTDHLESKTDDFLLNTSTYGEVAHVYLDLEPELFIAKKITTHEYKLELENKYHVNVENVFPEIVKLRMIKDDEEIKALKESISLTNKALNIVMKAIKDGQYEYKIANLFEYVIKDQKAGLSFPTIAASGANATILHYVDLASKMEDGHLLLLDLGANLTDYRADISRTYPVAGVFNPLQRQIYEIVLATNKAVIEFIRPGLTLAELQAFTIELMAAKLLSADLIKTKEEISKYYYHNVSHHLGLDTHDQSLRELKLVPGNVITVEPGLYFANYGIGIRIEDDVVVTEDGALNLSSEIIKEIADIEKYMKRK